jgi:hypothetical protein
MLGVPGWNPIVSGCKAALGTLLVRLKYPALKSVRNASPQNVDRAGNISRLLFFPDSHIIKARFGLTTEPEARGKGTLLVILMNRCTLVNRASAPDEERPFSSAL